MEIDRLILEVSTAGCEKIRRGAPVHEIDVEVEFLRKLYSRRDIIIVELKKAGFVERDIYAHLRAWQDGVATI